MFRFAGKNVEEGGFPRAVGADDPIAVAGGIFLINFFKKDPLHKGEA
jgi:hypothetical protein